MPSSKVRKPAVSAATKPAAAKPVKAAPPPRQPQPKTAMPSQPGTKPPRPHRKSKTATKPAAKSAAKPPPRKRPKPPRPPPPSAARRSPAARPRPPPPPARPPAGAKRGRKPKAGSQGDGERRRPVATSRTTWPANPVADDDREGQAAAHEDQQGEGTRLDEGIRPGRNRPVRRRHGQAPLAPEDPDQAGQDPRLPDARRNLRPPARQAGRRRDAWKSWSPCSTTWAWPSTSRRPTPKPCC